MECQFCNIISGKVKDYKIWEDECSVLLLDICPANAGHCILIPKKHCDDLFDLDSEIFLKLFDNAKKLSHPIKLATNAKRIGLVVVGFSVPHAHIHLVPLYKSNELFDPSLFNKAKPEELNEMLEKIRANL